MVQDGLPRKRQAKAHSILLAGGGEGLEKAIDDGGRDTGAGIFDIDEDTAVMGRCGDGQASSGGHYFEGVGNQIDEDALQAGRHALHFERLIDLDVLFDLLGFQQVGRTVEGGADDVGEAEQVPGAARFAGHVQQVLKQFLNAA